MTEVRCKKCNWKGDSSELIILLNGKLVPPICPKCFSQEIEFVNYKKR